MLTLVFALWLSSQPGTDSAEVQLYSTGAKIIESWESIVRRILRDYLGVEMK